MSTADLNRIRIDIVERLSEPDSLNGLFHQHIEGTPLPSGEVLEEIVNLCRSLLFPGFFGKSTVNHLMLKYQMGLNTERLFRLLANQVWAGLCFCNTCENESASDIEQKRCRAEEVATNLIARLPEIRKALATDVEVAYNGDPAAYNKAEVIACYPIIKAMINYRVAHELHLQGTPLIPRMITEMAHSETGMDIHPAAEIGNYFTIDHGTGTVIGATCIIGNHVKLYQGVTLGAKSFPLDDNNNPIKGIPRHPIIEDNVVIYANATILGRITIGKDCVVGANTWVTEDMKPNTKIYTKS